MKQKLLIFLGLIFLLIMLVGLNAVSYVQKEKIPDSEDYPNRSSYNAGATGTRAFYDLLAETGKKVRRWQEPFPTSGEFDANQFSTFVIIGKTRRGLEKTEVEHILDWVSKGGRLIVIDREPSDELISTTSNWSISKTLTNNPTLMVDPSNQNQMIAEIDAVKPTQPTLFTMQVNGVQQSRFASSINIKRLFDEDEFKEVEESDSNETQGENNSSNGEAVNDSTTTASPQDETGNETGNPEVDKIFKTPTPTPIESAGTPLPHIKGDETYDVSAIAPVIHLANKDTNLLADFPLGNGQIIFLSDPYIVSNGGIKLVDNAQLAINIVTAREGIIAFDEYHQGYGRNENLLFQYFAGTPVIPIFLQIFLLVALVFFSQSRRFARPLPDDEPNRLSKLEYVSAMAQLQGRTKAYDLAIENIYTDFRRRVARLVGIDNYTATRKELAEKIAERVDKDVNEIEDLMFKCEDIMHGEPTKKKEIVHLTSRLRKIEEALGLRRGKKRD